MESTLHEQPRYVAVTTITSDGDTVRWKCEHWEKGALRVGGYISVRHLEPSTPDRLARIIELYQFDCKWIVLRIDPIPRQTNNDFLIYAPVEACSLSRLERLQIRCLRRWKARILLPRPFCFESHTTVLPEKHDDAKEGVGAKRELVTVITTQAAPPKHRPCLLPRCIAKKLCLTPL